MFTFIPWKRLNLSFGNSVIYSDQYFNPAYFIPVFFYKSVDHTYNGATDASGQNAQMFIDISSRLIPRIHLYYSMFVDVLSFSTITNDAKHANHWSMQGGIRLSNFMPNLTLTIEYIRNNPLVYKNDLTTLYASNWYSLGHYLQDNAQELYFELNYKPYSKLRFSSWYVKALKGPNFSYDREKDPVTGISMVLGNKFLEQIDWEQEHIGIKATYQLSHDFFVFVEFESINTKGNVNYNSSFYKANPKTFSFGLNFGFY
jgi:hypothetical protein